MNAEEIKAAVVMVRTQERNWQNPYRQALELLCTAALRAVELERERTELAEALRCVDQAFADGRTQEGGFKRNPREIALKALRKLDTQKAELDATKKLDDHMLATTEQALLRAKCERGHEKMRAEEAERERDQLRAKLAKTEEARAFNYAQCAEAHALIGRLNDQVTHWREARRASQEGGEALKAELDKARAELQWLSERCAAGRVPRGDDRWQYFLAFEIDSPDTETLPCLREAIARAMKP